jgi:hypothetical protein
MPGSADTTMARNPLLNERHRARGRERPRIPILGGERPRRRHRHLPAFSTHDEYLASEKDVVASIQAHPHPLDILVDGSVFSPSRVDLVRHLLASTEMRLILPVALELVDLFNMSDERTRELRDVLFPRGRISALLRQDGMRVLPGHRRVAAKLAELLHLRRRALQGPFEQFRAQHGREPVGRERSAIIQGALRAGVGERTLQLANKGDDLTKVADEWLAVCCVLAPILTGRDCLVLTADADVADHVFELHTLIHEQYGSVLIADDLRRNPARYPHSHAAQVGFMKPGAVAYGRDVDPDYLRPSVALTCASWVINVTDLSSFVAIATRDAARTLALQNESPTQRVADGGDGRNLHMTSSAETGCRGSKMHFVVGEDSLVRDFESQFGRICISALEFAFVLGAKKRITPMPRVWMPGVPRAWPPS